MFFTALRSLFGLRVCRFYLQKERFVLALFLLYLLAFIDFSLRLEADFSQAQVFCGDMHLHYNSSRGREAVIVSFNNELESLKVRVEDGYIAVKNTLSDYVGDEVCSGPHI